MTDALARMLAAKEKADAAATDQANLAAYVADRVEHGGWSSADAAAYRATVAALMKGDDAAVLAMFPPGTYASADEARRDARAFWAMKGAATPASGILRQQPEQHRPTFSKPSMSSAPSTSRTPHESPARA